jgi:hypothetical protein
MLVVFELDCLLWADSELTDMSAEKLSLRSVI